MASDKFEAAKAEAMAGYLDPGPNHLNCGQAVLRCCLLASGKDPELTKIGSYLGGGMARMGQVCGALSGAAVGLGLFADASAGEGKKGGSATFDWMQELIRKFEAEFGAVTCRDLLGCDISTPEGFRAAKKSQATRRCPEFVRWTCDRLAEILDSEGEQVEE
jgi:C_GCAxxG_C_C family probable redox protein